MVFQHQLPSGVYVLPQTLGATVKATAEALHADGAQATQESLLYMEKAGGFQCRFCMYAVPQNATHGRCEIMQGTIHLDQGCCAAWMPDQDQLHLYREKFAS
jgi:pyrrolidone-carboxylate peptidase